MKIFQFKRIFKDGLVLPEGRVYQIEELSLSRGGTMFEHIQGCDEITYVISGRAKIYSDTNINDIAPGQIHFIKKGHTHKIEVYPDEDLRYICLGFTLSSDNKLAESFTELTKRESYFLADDDSTVKALCSLIVDESYRWDDYSEIMISRYLSQIIVSLYRILNGKGLKIPETDKMGAISNQTIYKVLRYIDREYVNMESVKEVSEILSYSEYYISHLFKSKMGITIKEYITRKKIEHACELLKTSPLGVEEISNHLNFASSHSFRRAFKEITGVSPREYKNK